MDETVFLGNFIKMQRERRNLNISQFAYKCKFSRSYLSQIESGKVSPSEKFEVTIAYIFECLGLNFENFEKAGSSLQCDIDNLLKCIFQNIQHQRDMLYSKLVKSENTILSYKFFPRYCLCKFVYNTNVENKIGADLDTLMKTLLDNTTIFDIYDQVILYTFTGVYYRKKANLIKSEEYLNLALKLGNFNGISSITYYQIAITQSLQNRLVPAYSNIQKANAEFFNEKNFKRLIFSQTQEAIILGRCKEYIQAETLLNQVLTNYQLSDELRNALYMNLAQLNYIQKKYKKVIPIIDKINTISDNLIFMKLQVYYQLSNINDFNLFYNASKDKFKGLMFKQKAKILYMRINEESKCDEYIKLLLESLSNPELKSDVEMEIFIIDMMIEYYDSMNKYKLSNKYLKMKIILLEA